MNLADQIAALSKRITDLRGMVPSYEWATVASVSPPTVILDSDVTNTPRPVADVLVPNLAVADRVEVRAIGSRRDVIARAGGAPAAATTATADTLVKRDAHGRAQVVDPVDPSDIDTMGARDAAIAAATEFAFQRCIPTGVASSGSTATIDPATGVVSLPAGCTGVRLDGVLDPAWETRLVCRLEVRSGHATDNSLWLRLAQAGTVNSNTGYQMAGQWRQYNGMSGIYATNSGNAAAVGPVSGSSAYIPAHVELTLARAHGLNNYFFFSFRSFTYQSARGAEGGGYTPGPTSGGEYDGVYLFPQGTSPVMQGEIYVETRRLN